MDLHDVINQMIQENQTAGQPTELRVGTVVSAAPLEISINSQMAPLRAGVLYLTSAVVEKKIPVLRHKHAMTGLGHSHTVSGIDHTHTLGGSKTDSALSGSYATSEATQGSYDSSEALTDIACMEAGKTLPVENGYIILNRGLRTGDKVLLLRVQSGQKFVVLSRVFEEG